MAASVFIIPVISYAESDSEKLKELREEIADKKKELEAGKDKEADLFKELGDLEMAISENEDKLVVLEKELKEAEEKVETQTDNLNSRLRNMYKSGSVGFIDVLFDSSSFSEFLTNLDMVEMIHSSDQELLKDLEEAHQAVETKKNEVETMQAELKESKAVVEAEKAEIAASNEKTAAMLDDLEADADALYDKIKKEASTSSNSTYEGSGEMAWPAPGYICITSYYGGRKDPITGKASGHGGMDIASDPGNPIVAGESGRVITAAYHYSYGNYVVIDHGGGVTTWYAHCSKLLVSYGQQVSRGQQIAKIGSTGRSTGPHLHFEVRINGGRVDPYNYIM